MPDTLKSITHGHRPGGGCAAQELSRLQTATVPCFASSWIFATLFSGIYSRRPIMSKLIRSTICAIALFGICGAALAQANAHAKTQHGTPANQQEHHAHAAASAANHTSANHTAATAPAVPAASTSPAASTDTNATLTAAKWRERHARPASNDNSVTCKDGSTHVTRDPAGACANHAGVH